MIETTRPELVAYQKERLAKFVSENQKLKPLLKSLFWRRLRLKLKVFFENLHQILIL